jgi:predicted nuclease of predicted toxin-antitoxin system
MKLLVDENLGSSVSKWLRQQGHDVICIGSDFAGITDMEVLKKAQIENRILITCDTDFGELVFKNKQVHNGIILLRMNNMNFEKILKFLTDTLNQYSHQLSNNFVVVSDNGIRVIPYSSK